MRFPFARRLIPSIAGIGNQFMSGKVPEPAIADAMDLHRIRIALSGLPAEFLAPLRLQVEKGYSMMEIAAELNLVAPSVPINLFQARKRLRSACGEDTSLDPAG